MSLTGKQTESPVSPEELDCLATLDPEASRDKEDKKRPKETMRIVKLGGGVLAFTMLWQSFISARG